MNSIMQSFINCNQPYIESSYGPYSNNDSENLEEDQSSSSSFSSPTDNEHHDSDIDFNHSKRRKTMFSKDEDDRLIQAVKEFGEKDWGLIASIVGNRTRRQCRERWKKFLCPSLNHSPWTFEEDQQLLFLYQQLGPKWTLISNSFKNRTDINVKTRYTVLKRKMQKEQKRIKQIQQYLNAHARKIKSSLASKDSKNSMNMTSNVIKLKKMEEKSPEKSNNKNFELQKIDVQRKESFELPTIEDTNIHSSSHHDNDISMSFNDFNDQSIDDLNQDLNFFDFDLISYM